MNDLPKPLTKNDPIRWDFTQTEIEKMMNIIQETIEHTIDQELYNNLKSIKDDWQRKINYNRERGYWQ